MQLIAMQEFESTFAVPELLFVSLLHFNLFLHKILLLFYKIQLNHQITNFTLQSSSKDFRVLLMQILRYPKGKASNVNLKKCFHYLKCFRMNRGTTDTDRERISFSKTMPNVRAKLSHGLGADVLMVCICCQGYHN